MGALLSVRDGEEEARLVQGVRSEEARRSRPTEKRLLLDAVQGGIAA
jgi:hypothetical protein